MNRSSDIAITGMGLVSPLGLDLESSWDGLSQGLSGAQQIEKFDVDGLEDTIAAPVKNYDPDDYFEKKRQRRLDGFIQYGLVATDEALDDAGYEPDNPTWDPREVGVVAGSGIGGIQTTEEQHKRLLERGASRVSPMTVPKQLINMVSGQIALTHGFEGPSSSVVTACATSLDCIGLGLQWIRSGRAKTVIVGGAEHSITPLCIAGFKQIKALSKRSDEPEKASRPFDRDRDGFVMGAGAAMMVLEDPEQAEKRGADIHGWIEGYAQTNDAHHETSPPESGEGASRAMRRALEDADSEPDSIEHINAHATSTPNGDKAEIKAIEDVFGARDDLYVTSTKSMIGHLLGGAGAAEAVICLKALQENRIPPTINCDNPEPEPSFSIVRNESKNAELNRGMNNAFGFGGHNASIVLRSD